MKKFATFRTMMIGLAAITFFWSTTSSACSMRSIYKSVVLNTPPDKTSPEIYAFRVKIDKGYFAGDVPSLQGLRAQTIEQSGAVESGSLIQITGKLGPICNTWVENWSSNHDIDDGVLSGYIVGKIIGESEGHLIIRPMMFRSVEFRNSTDDLNGDWMPLERRYLAEDGGRWVSIRFDAEALANNLAETNELIREGLEHLRDDR
ncbi:MAG: hypothetical protein WA948_10400 [Pontixanthobacter sp.]